MDTFYGETNPYHGTFVLSRRYGQIDAVVCIAVGRKRHGTMHDSELSNVSRTLVLDIRKESDNKADLKAFIDDSTRSHSMDRSKVYLATD